MEEKTIIVNNENQKNLIRNTLIKNMKNKGVDDSVIAKRFNISTDDIKNIFVEKKININKKETKDIHSPINRITNIRKTIEYLREKYPKAFMEPIKPLKIGVNIDILEDKEVMKGISKTKLSRALGYYARSIKYINAIINERFRIDLNGEICEEISERHKNDAKVILKDILKNIKDRKVIKVGNKKTGSV